MKRKGSHLIMVDINKTPVEEIVKMIRKARKQQREGLQKGEKPRES